MCFWQRNCLNLELCMKMGPSAVLWWCVDVITVVLRFSSLVVPSCRCQSGYKKQISELPYFSLHIPVLGMTKTQRKLPVVCVGLLCRNSRNWKHLFACLLAWDIQSANSHRWHARIWLWPRHNMVLTCHYPPPIRGWGRWHGCCLQPVCCGTLPLVYARL